VDQGGLIFDNTPVEAIENDEAPFRVIAKNHSVITSKQVVITTHYPFFDMEGPIRYIFQCIINDPGIVLAMDPDSLQTEKF